MLDLNTKNNIERSGIFLVFGTRHYFKEYVDGGRIRHIVNYAKSLDKPFRVLLDKGVTIPEGFEDNVKDYLIKDFDLKNIKDLNPAKTNELREFIGIN